MRDKRGVTECHGKRDRGPNLPQKQASSLNSAPACARPFGEDPLSRIKTVTQRDVTVGWRDSDRLRFGSARHHHGNRTAIAKNVLEIARRVIENVGLGRVYDARTLEWAKHIVKANPNHPPIARAGSAEGTSS